MTKMHILEPGSQTVTACQRPAELAYSYSPARPLALTVTTMRDLDDDSFPHPLNRGLRVRAGHVCERCKAAMRRHLL